MDALDVSNRIRPLLRFCANNCWQTLESTGAAAGFTETSGFTVQPCGSSRVSPARISPAAASYMASPDNLTSRSDTTSVPVDSRDSAPSAVVTAAEKPAG